MKQVRLEALSGLNPLGLFAALGALDAISRVRPELRSRLHWTDEIIPRAVISGLDDIDELVLALDLDRQMWATSTLLNWPEAGKALDDLKPSSQLAREWVKAVLHSDSPHVDAEVRLMAALLAEGGLDREGKTKPTHFHFTAGQQRFLVMIRELVAAVDADRLTEALIGPWRYDSPLPVLGWDARGDRSYAVTAINPSKKKKQGVPGADWLGFTGLSYFPVWAKRGKLVTTGCSENWKAGTFTWALWSLPLMPAVIRSLLRDSSLVLASSAQRKLRGISHVLRVPIRRTDQGGYGSFGAAEPVQPGTGTGIQLAPPTLLRRQ